MGIMSPQLPNTHVNFSELGPSEPQTPRLQSSTS